MRIMTSNMIRLLLMLVSECLLRPSRESRDYDLKLTELLNYMGHVPDLQTQLLLVQFCLMGLPFVVQLYDSSQ
jgi:hypothetical protein